MSAQSAPSSDKVVSREDFEKLKRGYLTLASTVSPRALLAAKLGETHGGRRDLYASFGYTAEVDYASALQRYQRLDIVSRVVNAYPDALWTRPPRYMKDMSRRRRPNTDAQDSGTDAYAGALFSELDDAIWKLDEDINFYHYINRVDRLAGIGKFSLLVLGFDDVRTEAQMAFPVDANRVKKLVYLQAFGFGDVSIVDYEDNPSVPEYGMPKTYKIKVRGSKGSYKSEGGPAEVIDGVNNPGHELEVHRTRVIHVADCLFDNEINGYPIVERVYNRLDDAEKVVGGAAEMFWLSGRQGLHIDIDKEMQVEEGDLAKMRVEVDDFMNDVRRVIRTRGAKVNNLGSDVANPDPVFNVVMSMISIATGIPQRIFIGSEQGKLASEQDRANWAVRINERRVLYAEPKILRPFVTRLQALKLLPQGRFWLEWPEAFQMSPLERGQTAAQQARAFTNIARGIAEYKKPIEGVDYPLQISRTKAINADEKETEYKDETAPNKLIAAKGDAPPNKTKTPAADKGDSNNSAGGVGGKPPFGKPTGAGNNIPPKPTTQTTTEDFQMKERFLINPEQGRNIVFARGELLGEAPIDDHKP
jgi:hypothetical protein